jgi:hypothetical protein
MKESDIVIRFAVRDDVDKIMKAFKDHWEADHILAHNKDFFLYLLAGNGDEINMVLGEEQSTGEIAGFLGFIKYSESICFDISLIYWKTISNKEAFLGVKLLLFLLKNVKPRVVFSLGINPKTALPVYKGLKYNVGKMDHYYRVSDRDEYKIAKVTDKCILPVIDSVCNIIPVPDFDFLKAKIVDSMLNETHPYKDINYIYHRYFDNPVRKYTVYAVTEDNAQTVSAFLICREMERFGAKILRIVDFLGKEKYFGYFSSFFQKLMDENNYEYIDCYCVGMSAQIMDRAGLIQRKETDENIIPNLFEPFVCENSDIYYFTSDNENFRSFRGDANQDQPRSCDRSFYK